MIDKNTIQHELKGLDSSLVVTSGQVLSVPDGYFEGFAEVMLAIASGSEAIAAQTEMEEISPLLAGISKKMPFSVPSNYFRENLETASIFDVDAESRFLAAAGKHLPYQVPAGYFEALAGELLAKVSEHEAKVVPLFARTWVRMAAAAVVTGALFIGGLQFFGGKQEADPIAQAPQKTEILIARNKVAIEQEIKKVSTKELEQFIQSVPAAAGSTVNTDTGQPAKEAKNLLKDVSVKDMESFLSDLPASDDELSLTD